MLEPPLVIVTLAALATGIASIRYEPIIAKTQTAKTFQFNPTNPKMPYIVILCRILLKQSGIIYW